MIVDLKKLSRKQRNVLTADWKDEDFDYLVATCEEDLSTEDHVCCPVDLLHVCWVEAKGAYAWAENKNSSATGLIQWMADDKGKYYGLTREQFVKLGTTGQLPYLRRWFLQHKGKLDRVERIYTAVFLPAFVAQSIDPEFVLCADDSPKKNLRNAYLWNKFFDRNKDGKIQVKELAQALEHEIGVGGKRLDELHDRLVAAIARRVAMSVYKSNPYV